MLKNYFKIAIRNILRNKSYSLINISGLAIGIASTILIMLWVVDELNYDQFHQNIDKIYRVAKDESAAKQETKSALTSPPVVPTLKQEFPEISMATRFDSWGRRLVKYKENVFYEAGYRYIDAEFFEMFSFKFIHGDPHTALSDLYSVVLTEESAKKYFGNEEALGKTLNINDQFDVTVTGVIKNIPENSTLQFDFLSSFDNLVKEFLGEHTNTNWGYNSLHSFVLLNENTNLKELNYKLAGVLPKHFPEDKDILFLQPFSDIHLYSDLEHDFAGLGDIKYVWIFSALALFILLIACINFMNLTTARASKRAKEIGIKKVVGSNRFHLMIQFFGETFFLSFIALGIALLMVELLLPFYNEISGKNLVLNFTNNWIIYIISLIVVTITGILSGSYPAIFLSSLTPVKALKKNLFIGNRSVFRKALVITQFTLSVFLIIGTIIITQQLSYLQNKELGINSEQIIYMRLVGDLNEKYQTLKDEFLKEPYVKSITASMALPTDIDNSPGSPEWEGKDPENNFEIKADFIDYDYLETFDIELAEGRSFSRKFATDDSAAYIVNQKAVQMMGLASPIGKKFSFWEIQGNIIGVMKDFHFQPLHTEIRPIVLKIYPRWFRFIYLKINSENIAASIESLKEKWTVLNPGYPFEHKFLDENYDKLYMAEQRLKTLFNYFTFLAIFIACLGLFGLASFTAEQRTKEIGIRKVLGAPIFGIILLLSKEFTKWIVFANSIAWPFAWFIMYKWLQNFAYRIDINWQVFLLAGSIALLIAIITVSFQAIKAAIANPFESLRYE